MQLEYTPKFKKDFRKLDEEIQQQVIKKLRQFAENPYLKSFRTKPMKGKQEIWEAHITLNIVFTFEWDSGLPLENRTVYLRRIGTHDIYKHP